MIWLIILLLPILVDCNEINQDGDKLIYTQVVSENELNQKCIPFD